MFSIYDHGALRSVHSIRSTQQGFMQLSHKCPGAGPLTLLSSTSNQAEQQPNAGINSEGRAPISRAKFQIKL